MLCCPSVCHLLVVRLPYHSRYDYFVLRIPNCWWCYNLVLVLRGHQSAQATVIWLAMPRPSHALDAIASLAMDYCHDLRPPHSDSVYSIVLVQANFVTLQTTHAIQIRISLMFNIIRKCENYLRASQGLLPESMSSIIIIFAFSVRPEERSKCYLVWIGEHVIIDTY